MKLVSKKLISALLSVALIFASLTVVPFFENEALAATCICKIGETEYTSLFDAVSASKDGDTIVVTADTIETKRILLDERKSIKITDDGASHTINLANSTTTSAAGYGRGIQVGNDTVTASLSIASSKTGGLTLDGKGCASTGVVAYNGYLYIEGVTLCNFNNTYNKIGSAIRIGFSESVSGDVTLRDCTFSNNKCTSHKNEDIYLYNNSKLTLEGTNNGLVFEATKAPVTIGESFDTDSLVSLIQASYTAGEMFLNGAVSDKTIKSFKLSNKSYELYSNGCVYPISQNISFGSISENADGSYSYPSVTSNISATNTALCIWVDNGSFAFDSGTFAIDSMTYVNANGSAGNSKSISTGKKFQAVTIENYSGLNNTSVASLLKGIIFYPDSIGVEQTVSCSCAEIQSGEFLFGDSIYSYTSDSCTWAKAHETAIEEEMTLACIDGRILGKMISKKYGVDAYTAGAKLLDGWYWVQGETHSQFASTNVTTEGINGAYTNWAEGEPSLSGDRLLLDKYGEWYSVDQNDEHGFYTETSIAASISQSTAKTMQQEIKTKTILRGYSFSFDGEIAMNYYFDFGSDLDGGQIGVKVDGVETKYTVEEIKSAGLTDESGSYGLNVSLPAKKLMSTVSFYAYDESGDFIKAYGVGTDYGYGPYTFITSYIKHYEANDFTRYCDSYTEDAYNLLLGLLNYSAATQIQFGYKTEELANVGYEDEEWNDIPSTASFDESYIKYLGDGKVISAVALSADSKNAIRIYFENNISSVEIDGIEVATKTGVEGCYAEINVTSQNFAHIFKITADGETLLINTYKLIELICNGTSSADAKRTSYMLYKYGKKSASYAGEIEAFGADIDAVINTAYAYLDKEMYTQYDQYTLLGTSDNRTRSYAKKNSYSQSRRQLYESPEEISSQNVSYFDCSSLAYNIYRESFGDDTYSTLGIPINDMSTSNMINVTKYSAYTCTITDSSTYNDVLDDIMEVIQPGDLLVYYDNGGHVMFYTGTGFIHSTSKSITFGIKNGGSYKYTNDGTGYDITEAGGSIHYVTLDDIKSNPSAFFGAHYNGKLKVNLLRPLDVLSGKKTLTDSAKARQQLGTLGVSITAIDNTQNKELYRGRSVAKDDVITYTIRINNKEFAQDIASIDRTVDVSYKLPTGLSPVSAEGGEIYDNLIIWNDVYVASGDFVSLTFNAKVSASKGATIRTGEGTVSLSAAETSAMPLAFSFREISVDEKVSDGVYNAIAATKAETGISGGISYVKSFYSKYSYILNTESNFLGNIFPTSGNYHYTNWSAQSINYLSDKIVGGRLVYNNSTSDYNTRIRSVSENNLQIGDLVAAKYLTNSDSIIKYYIYLGNDKMIETSSESSATSIVSASDILDGLLDTEYFAVLRVVGRASNSINLPVVNF